MMGALFDTHVWLWYLLGDDRVSLRQRQVIENPEMTLWLSPISVWEALLLIERNRIQVDTYADNWIDRALKALPVREAPVTFGIARRSRMLELEHNDPADRFLAATALELGVVLLSADEKLFGCRGLTCV